MDIYIYILASICKILSLYVNILVTPHLHFRPWTNAPLCSSPNLPISDDIFSSFVINVTSLILISKRDPFTILSSSYLISCLPSYYQLLSALLSLNSCRPFSVQLFSGPKLLPKPDGSQHQSPEPKYDLKLLRKRSKRKMETETPILTTTIIKTHHRNLCAANCDLQSTKHWETQRHFRGVNPIRNETVCLHHLPGFVPRKFSTQTSVANLDLPIGTTFLLHFLLGFMHMLTHFCPDRSIYIHFPRNFAQNCGCKTDKVEILPLAAQRGKTAPKA